MQAGMLECPQCGAAADKDQTRCTFCNAQLATVACPSCFGLVFVGAKFCSHCGSRALARYDEDAPAGPRKCPRCTRPMTPVAIGNVLLDECAQCSGIWLDPFAFEQICTTSEVNAAVLGSGSPLSAPGSQVAKQPHKSFYIPCPGCGARMNRVNFVGCSGVVVDVCKGHGTWFDRDELRQVVEFLRKGGARKALEREKEKLQEERRRLEQARLAASRGSSGGSIDFGRDDRGPTFLDLLELLFR